MSICQTLCYPTSEVRGRRREDPISKGQWSEELTTSEVRVSGLEYQTAMVQEGPRGATPRPRSGGVAERIYPASKVRGRGWEELCHAPKPKARGGGWENQPHVQGAMEAWVQEGLEELSHIEGQEGQR